MREISEEEKIGYFKPQINYVPANLNFDECLKDKKLFGFKNFDKDYCAKLISGIYTVPVYNKQLRYEVTGIKRPFYNMSSTEMYRQNKDYRKYLDLLLDLNVLETDNQFFIGEKSKGYRFTIYYHNQKPSAYYNYKFGNYVSDEISYSSKISVGNNYSSTIRGLINYLPSIQLDYNKALANLNVEFNNGDLELEKYNCTFCSLNKIENGDFFAKQDDYGRLHTNLTNLKKEYRNYVMANGETLGSLDFKNSQPYLSLILSKSSFWEDKAKKEELTFKDLNENIKDRVSNIDTIIMFTKSVEDNEDLVVYRDLVLNGGFYEYFLEALVDEGIKCKDRKHAKVAVFEIFFSKTAYLNKSKSAMVFKSLFPTIFRLFAIIKKSGHNLLALILQCIESKIVIEGIVGNFMKEFPKTPIFTIHDSVVVPIKQLKTVCKDIINYSSLRTGYSPTIETEIFDPINI